MLKAMLLLDFSLFPDDLSRVRARTGVVFRLFVTIHHFS